MFSQGYDSNKITLNDILNKVSEGEILAHFLGINKIPTLIHSPLRNDNKPSFGLYSRDGNKIFYVDFSTNEKGSIFDLFCKLWNCNYQDCLEYINKTLINKENVSINITKPHISINKLSDTNTILQCKIRNWEDYDIEYWKSYGITLEWLKWAEIYPISHKIITKNNKKYIFPADKYAYAYVERKEGRITLKIYQPYNTKGFKWANKHDSSIISLWTKIPEYGEKVCICSSVKDALCLSCNTKIPAIAIQGEGYSMSNTAINELKRRYTKVYILFDNDKPGLADGKKLSDCTGFTNIVLPCINGCKDISDTYKELGKNEFLKVIKPLFN